MCDFEFEAVAPGPALAAFPCRSNTSLGVSDLCDSLRLTSFRSQCELMRTRGAIGAFNNLEGKEFQVSLLAVMQNKNEQNLHSGGSCKKHIPA